MKLKMQEAEPWDAQSIADEIQLFGLLVVVVDLLIVLIGLLLHALLLYVEKPKLVAAVALKLLTLLVEALVLWPNLQWRMLVVEEDVAAIGS